MNKDIRIKCEEGSFKYRVSGILISNNKVLTVSGFSFSIAINNGVL